MIVLSGCQIRMLSDKQKENLKELLTLVPQSELRLLCSTVTNNMIEPTNTEEAIDAILLHSATVESVLSRKKLSKEIVFRYLHNNNIAILSTVDKRTMIRMVLKLWNCDSTNYQSPSAVDGQSSMIPSKPEVVPNKIEISEVDEMAHQFTQWFYSMLNQHEAQIPGKQLGIEHFWEDCSMCLNLNSENDSSKFVVQNSAENTVKLLCDTKTQHSLYFNPNMSNEGVHGRTEMHGLVKILVCGTLHQQNNCVGVFEQLFGLIRDPSVQNNWKIKFTELNLNSKHTITALPRLSEGTLLRSITSSSNSIS